MNNYEASITHLGDTRKLSHTRKRKLLGKIKKKCPIFESDNILTPCQLYLDPREGYRWFGPGDCW